MNVDYTVYEQEYDRYLSRVRSFLSSNARSLTTLRECERLLNEARRCTDAMEQIATESGDTFKVKETQRRVEQDIMPLLQEVDRAVKERESGGFQQHQQQRNELFSGYRAPTLGQNDNNEDDLEMLIRNSEDLLRESQAFCTASEQTGTETLSLMGRQREQLQNASGHMAGTRAYLTDAKDLLQQMTRKALKNKRFLQGIIAILIVANMVAFAAIIMKKRKK